jgi:hypothetical protein
MSLETPTARCHPSPVRLDERTLGIYCSVSLTEALRMIESDGHLHPV